MVVWAIVVFVAAFAATGCVTALIRRVAPRVGLTDPPDTHRKVHKEVTPLGGGLALVLTLCGVLGVLLLLPNPFRIGLRADWDKVLPLLVASLVIVAIGLVDDRLGLRGRQKLLGQILAACILIAGGLVIEQVGIFGRQIPLGLLSVPFTLFWLLGGVNAINLLDGIDGLASMIGLILVSAIAGMATITGHVYVAVIGLVFAGSLLGFLPFNLPPAKIFLGDAGSMLIGLLVGALAIQGSLKGPGTVLLAAALAVWTIPVFDTTAAIIRRKLTGRSVFTVDHGHLHHRLLDRLGSHLRVLGWVGLACALTSVAALISVFLKNDLVAVLTCGAVIGIFIVADLFGRPELLLLLSRLRRTLASLLPRPARNNGSRPQAAHRIQGSHRWEVLWEMITETAENLELARVCLDINMPAIHERFNAVWGRSDGDDDHCWQVQFPLIILSQYVGRLTVTSGQNGQSPRQDIERLLGLFEEVESQLSELFGEEAPVRTTAPVASPAEAGPDSAASVLTRKHPK